ncbi:unnamed protein product, partial [Mesorhabditis spiculigera]
MEKLREELSSRLAQLGSSLASSNEDAIMDDMVDYVPSPYEGPSTSAEVETTRILKKQPRMIPRTDALNEDEIVDSINAKYFIDDEEFDAITYELKKLSTSNELLEDIEREKLKLKTQLGVVSKRIAKLILEKSPDYSTQLETFSEIRKYLHELNVRVTGIRSILGEAKRRTGNALKILENEEEKDRLLKLKETLYVDCQFPQAIELCASVKEAASEYLEFDAVTDLMDKLDNTTQLIERELSATIPQLLVRFDADRYAFVSTAYNILEKQQEGAEDFVGKVSIALEGTARTLLIDNISAQLPSMAEQLEINELAKRLKPENVPLVFHQMGMMLCKILSNYQAMLRHHIEEDERADLLRGETSTEKGPFQLALRAHLPQAFNTAAEILASLLSPHDLSHASFDELLLIVDQANKFRRFGIAHFGADPDSLLRLLEAQALTFFERFHAERLGELCMFLENEVFALCPVPYQFTIFDLQEFSFLKEVRPEEMNDRSSDSSDFGYMVMRPDSPNPFSQKHSRSQLNSVSSINGKEAELPTPTTHRDLLSNYSEPADHVPPNLCNTALNLLRFFGRYMKMTTLVPTIAARSVPAITQLFNFFLYSIYSFFGRDGVDVGEVSPTLKKVLEAVKGSIQLHADGTHINLASLSCAIQLQYPDQLFAASERIMAFESLEFVARQLDLMRPVIETMTPEDSLLDYLEQFHSQTLSVVPEVRTLVLSCISSKALKFPVFVQQISQTRWDISDLKSQHSAYVDFLLQDIDIFVRRLEAVAMCVNVTVETRRLFWDRLIYYTFRALVQGYCESGGKCTSEGRALMQLDFQHLLGKLEHISGLKPVPHTAFVDAYIKAYYLPEASLEQWMCQHSEYSQRQLVSLLNTASHVSKKARQRIASALDL